MEGIPANKIKIMSSSAKKSCQILQELIELANQVLKEVADTSTGSIDEIKLAASNKFQKFRDVSCELQVFDLEDLDKSELNAFFANLVQIMYFHYYMMQKLLEKNKNKDSAGQGFMEKLISFIPFMGGDKNKN